MRNHFALLTRSHLIVLLVALALLMACDGVRAWDAKAPAQRVAYSATEKAAQRQAGAEALKKMNAARDAGDDGYTFKPGVYRFTGYRPFNFYNKANFPIRAANCTFIMESLTGELFLINKCSNMAIIGPLTLDADPLEFSQGKVMSLDEKARTADLEIMPGYPAPPVRSRLMIFGADGIWESPSPHKQWPFLEYSSFKWLDEAQRTARISIDATVLSLLKPGQYLTLGQGNGIGTLRDVDGMTIQDVTVYTGCTALISWGGGGGKWNYTRVKAVPAPGTSRLIGGSGPQHSFKGGSQVIFDGCEFNGSTDDDLNVGAGSYGMLFRQETPRRILVMNGDFKPGDEVRLFEKDSYREKLRAKIQVIESLDDKTLKDDAKQVQATLLKRREHDDPSLYRITLDRDAVAEPADIVENLSERGELFVMRNCKWTNSTVRVMVQGFKKGIFEDNTFTRVGQGLAVTMDSWWWEGGTWDECVIRNNTFLQTPCVTYWDSAAIHYGPSGVPNAAKPIFGPVTIAGNAISTNVGTGININAATAYTLKNNTVAATGAALTINGEKAPM